MAVDPRTAALTLSQIASYLELHGENRFKARAYQTAAGAVRGLVVDDLAPMLASGELAATRGLGPATVAVIRDLVEHGQSLYLDQLRTTTPEGLIEMARIPGLKGQRVFALHEALGIQTVDELEAAARDGRLERLPRYGRKTVDRILRGIAFLRASGAQRLLPHARVEGERLLAMVSAHPGVARAGIAGPLRRHCETVGAIDVVAGCSEDPVRVAASFTRIGGIEKSSGTGASVEILFVDGVRFRLHCAAERDYGMAEFVATGSAEHVAAVARRLIERGFEVGAAGLERGGVPIPTPDERTVYQLADLAFVDPVLREDRGEVDAAARDELPVLVSADDVRGILHCHTVYSDGSNTVEQMAIAARDRGWSYIGISDHSRSAFYAAGMSDAALEAQHEEIDRLNDAGTVGIRVLKGIEADILADGGLDHDDAILDRFDFVIGSVHSRFSMAGDAMTERVLRAMDDPRLTVLGHPTGRRLLSREPYSIDVEAVLLKAAANGIAVELNADPRRLDLDWRYLMRAKALGVRIAIGPDAHSAAGLDNMTTGIGMARKGWLEAGDVLNTGGADDVLAFARARRAS